MHFIQIFLILASNVQCEIYFNEYVPRNTSRGQTFLGFEEMNSSKEVNSSLFTDTITDSKN